MTAPIVLGIESSCDETAAAVVSSDGDVLSDVVHSQVALHAPYGGVIPELASRDHLRAIGPVVRKALADAGVSLGPTDGREGARRVDAIAVTCRPGLVGALLVGVQAAKGIAWAAGLPVVGVDHLVGHLLAPFLKRPNASAPQYPFVALLASGGHTALYRVDGPSLAQIRELGGTRDDAAGEAFDKVGKLLGLGYPGGPIVDRLALKGDATKVKLVRPMARSGSLEFSFSGLKTQVATFVAKSPPQSEQDVADLCASFQATATRVLVDKLVAAAEQESVTEIVLAGGVAANRELRERARVAAERRGLRLTVPPIASCTDNAAMIAYVGAQRIVVEGAAFVGDGLGLDASSTTSLPRGTVRGPSRGPTRGPAHKPRTS
ncbi:MAG: tRNA (adenosine(37)-N6)-threonylcarbamoyltransferase complex transferase subunit TsaD [Polyangiales bacterium]